jgi:hypothetical protein
MHAAQITKIVPYGNHGWRNFEGTRFNMDNQDMGFHKPEYEYCHLPTDDVICPLKPFTGQSITGGYWYHGQDKADQYAGSYIFAGE